MGQKLVKYGSGQCCQRPGCCTACFCERGLRHTKLGDSCLACANACPCLLSCRVPVTDTVLLLGLKGAGKTALLYYFLLGKLFATANPTKGFNNEVVFFNNWQAYEFWDPGGSVVQRELWSRYYRRLYVGVVIYVIDGFKYARADPKRRETILDDDRMELHTLIEEEELKTSKFIIFVNFTKHLSIPKQQEAIRDITDILELRDFPDGKITVVGSPDAVKKELGVETVTDRRVCCCCC